PVGRPARGSGLLAQSLVLGNRRERHRVDRRLLSARRVHPVVRGTFRTSGRPGTSGLLRRFQSMARLDQRSGDRAAHHDGREDAPGYPCRLDDQCHAADAFGAPRRPQGEDLTMVPDFALRIHAMIRSLREVVVPALPNDEMLAIDQANILVGYLGIMAEQHDRVFEYLLVELSEYAELLSALVEEANGAQSIEGAIAKARAALG